MREVMICTISCYSWNPSSDLGTRYRQCRTHEYPGVIENYDRNEKNF